MTGTGPGGWTVRIEGPADQLRYLLELAAAEGVEARAARDRRGAELSLPPGHPLAATLLSTPEASGCTVTLLAGDTTVATTRARRDRRRSPWAAPAAAVLVLVAAVALTTATPAPSGPDPRLGLGPAPVARGEVASALDGRTGDLLLYGGIAVSAPQVDLGDTWTRGTGGWRLRRTAVSPGPRFDAVMADDPAAGVVVLFGGRRRGPAAASLDDTWDWDGSAWSRRATATAPPPGDSARGLAYDAATRTLVLVTEPGVGTAETWTLGGDGWVAHPGAATPATGWIAPGPGGTVIAVVGPDAADRGATWRWDGSRWDEAAAPTAVEVEPLSALLAWDPATGRTLLVEVEFQDVDGAPAGGTWTWDGATWTEHHSSPAVAGAVGVTQPVVAGERPLVLLGGPQDAGAYRDAWAWDGSAWRRS